MNRAESDSQLETDEGLRSDRSMLEKDRVTPEELIALKFAGEVWIPVNPDGLVGATASKCLEKSSGNARRKVEANNFARQYENLIGTWIY